MLRLPAVPITAEAFRPYGEVLEGPPDSGRTYFDGALANGRTSAAPSLSLSHSQPTTGNVLDAIQMERHQFASQSFVPMDVARYLVIVAPHGAAGRPDTDNAKAFMVPGHIGITYGKDVWHHPMTVLDRPGRFAIFMWLDGTETDEEFVTLPEPFQVAWPQ